MKYWTRRLRHIEHESLSKQTLFRATTVYILGLCFRIYLYLIRATINSHISMCAIKLAQKSYERNHFFIDSKCLWDLLIKYRLSESYSNAISNNIWKHLKWCMPVISMHTCCLIDFQSTGIWESIVLVRSTGNLHDIKFILKSCLNSALIPCECAYMRSVTSLCFQMVYNSGCTMGSGVRTILKSVFER